MKNRILIITPRPPFPLSSGGEHAQFHFIEAMQKEFNLSICFEINSSDYNSNYDDFLKLKELWKEVTFFPLINIENPKIIKKIIKKLKDGIYNIKKTLYKFLVNEKTPSIDFIRYNSLINQPFLIYKADFTNHVAKILKDYQFEFIQIEFINLAPLVYILPKDAVKILVHHEIRYIRIKREVDLFEKQDHYDLCRLEAIKDQEISLLNKFDKIITLTEIDKNILAKDISQERIYVSPATINTKKIQEVEFIPFKNKLVFIGSSIHLPNKDGVKWFIDTVLPIIKKDLPDVQLNIVGNWDKPFIKEYSKKNIKFLGFVEDLDEVMNNSLMIVPIRIGSGMRLKIVETINYNRPFITTTIGVEGLNLDNNRDCIIADSSEAFANGICLLSNNIWKQQELVTNAMSKIKEVCSFELAVKKRLDFYKTLE